MPRGPRDWGSRSRRLGGGDGSREAGADERERMSVRKDQHSCLRNEEEFGIDLKVQLV